MIPPSWWVTCAFRDDRESFYTKAALEAERMHLEDKLARPYVTAFGDRGDFWQKPKGVAYHDEAA